MTLTTDEIDFATLPAPGHEELQAPERCSRSSIREPAAARAELAKATDDRWQAWTGRSGRIHFSMPRVGRYARS